MVSVLKIRNLTKRYGAKVVIDNISLTLEKGDVLGLIGKNGAGKTTLMRLITSLSHPDTGEIELFGQTVLSAHLSGSTPLAIAGRRMGCIVEAPALFLNLTASQNLEYYRIQRGIPGKNSVRKSLEQVNLADTDKTKVKNFSLGMKQRLGLALALLSSPDLLILDEPFNGLDPTGIAELRDLLKHLNEHGVTLLISSHLLAELSQIATRYAIIHQGKLIKTMTQRQLQEEDDTQAVALSLTVDDAAKAAVVLETILHIHNYKQVGPQELRVYDSLDNPAALNLHLHQNGIRVASLHKIGPSLEDYFIKTIDGAAP
ncbi:MAG: ATP-binding cassette domain-containing protein [Peptococcaceae bacterium]|nr:ATP-binding cassette domain-containing protein [Peptococcaceae bacterium]